VERSRGCARDDVHGSRRGPDVDPERAAPPVVRAQDAMAEHVHIVRCSDITIFDVRFADTSTDLSEMRTKILTSVQERYAPAGSGPLRVRSDCGRLAWQSPCRVAAPKIGGGLDRVVRCGHQGPGRGSWVARGAPVYELRTGKRPRRRRRGRVGVGVGGEGHTGKQATVRIADQAGNVVAARGACLPGGERAASLAARRRTAGSRSGFLCGSPLGRG
jgi:hypothetical protein